MLSRLSPRAMGISAGLLFLLVAGQFFLTTPILEGPDSWEHFKYIRYLLIDHRFPTLNDPDPANAPNQEAAQYPLYYLLGAAVSFPVSTADYFHVVATNPHAGDPRGNGNGNFLYHRPFSGFPHGTELAARLVELLSIACGLVTVGCTVFLGWQLLPRSRWLALGAGAVLAADPPFAAFSTFVSNDSLVTALSSVAIVLMVVWVIDRSSKWSWLSALAVALAVLAKFNAVGLATPYLLAALIVRPSWRARLTDAGKLALSVAVIDGWWMVRNQLLHGDFSGMVAVNRHTAGQGYDPFKTSFVDSMDRAIHGLPAILHGLFSTGAYGIDSPPSLYMVTTVLGVVGLAAGAVAALAGARKQPWLWIVLGWAGINLAELVVYTYIAGPGARLLFPSIACLAVLVALGWATLLRAVRLPALGWLAGAGGLAVSLAVPPLVTEPAYALPPVLSQLPSSATPLHATFDDAVELVGAESGGEQAERDLTLYWRLVQPTDARLDAFVHVDSPDPAYTSGASYDGAPGGGRYPPMYWQPGQIVADHYVFHLNPDSRADKRNALPLSVRAGMYDETGGKVPAEPSEAGDRGLEVAVWKLPGQVPPADQAQPLASFDGKLALLSAKANMAGAAALNVDLRWLAESPPVRDYTVFVQLLSPQGQVLAQHDSFPLDGRYPTSEWSANEQVFDTVTLGLKEPIEPGDRVVAGVYVLPEPSPIPTASGDHFAVVPLAET